MKALQKGTLGRLGFLDIVLASTPVVLLLASACTGGAYPAATGKRAYGAQPARLATTANMASQTSAQAGDATDGSQVTIKDFQFTPANVSVTAGTTMTWTNNDSLTHTVTANDGSFDSSNLMPGQQFSSTFATPGTYSYHCSIHPFMTATIVVQ